MPDRDLPRWARALGRLICAVSYLLAILVAIGDRWLPAVTITGSTTPAQVAVTSAAMGLLGVLGFVGVLLHRWRWEWVPASALAVLLLVRAAPVWWSLADVPTRLSAAAMMTLGALCLAKRALDLWVFATKTGSVATWHRRRTA